MRRTAGVLVGLVVALGAASGASGATISPVYDGSGAYVQSSSVEHASGVAWKLSSDPHWTRCRRGSVFVSFADLPPGPHVLQAADDINTLWYPLYTGATAACYENPPPAPSGMGYREYRFWVGPPPADPAPDDAPAPSPPPSPPAQPTPTYVDPVPPVQANRCRRALKRQANARRSFNRKRRAFRRHRTVKRKRAMKRAKRQLRIARRTFHRAC